MEEREILNLIKELKSDFKTEIKDLKNANAMLQKELKDIKTKQEEVLRIVKRLS